MEINTQFIKGARFAMKLIFEDEQKALLVDDFEVQELICDIVFDMYFRSIDLDEKKEKELRKAIRNLLDDYGDYQQLEKAFAEEIKDYYRGDL